MAKESSPPSEDYFQQLTDDYGMSPLANKVLEGEVTTELDQFPATVRAWIQQFKRTEKEKKCRPIDGFIFPDEFQHSFKTVRERTSSSPSGIHYTYWKCIASDNEMSSYCAAMMRMPFMYGFMNDRWAKCIDVMLEKKAGERKIHQLRIIGLVEADFNTALKAILCQATGGKL